MPRTTLEIATEARDLIDSSSTKFVPAPIVKIGELSVEFMEAAAAELDAMRAQLVPTAVAATVPPPVVTG